MSTSNSNTKTTQVDTKHPDITPTTQGTSTSIPTTSSQGEHVHDHQQQPDQQQTTASLLGMAFSGAQLHKDVQKERRVSRDYDEQRAEGWTPGTMRSQEGDQNLDYCQ